MSLITGKSSTDSVPGVHIQGVNVTNVMTWALNRMAQGIVYQNHWSNAFCMEENEKSMVAIYDELNKIDFSKLTEEEAYVLGFRRPSRDSKDLTIPMWIYACIPNGISLKRIMGPDLIKGRDKIDTESRLGLLASYSITLPIMQIEEPIKEEERDIIDKIREE